MKVDMIRQTRLILALLGCPIRLVEHWTEAGMRRFLRRWANGQTGSLRELELVLGLADPAVRVVGKTECEGKLTITITWSRWTTFEELTTFSRCAADFAGWVSAVIAWWEPLGLDTTWTSVWPSAALFVSQPSDLRDENMDQDTRLLEKFAADFLRVRRCSAVPPRCWVSLTADALTTRGRHEVVLGDTSLNRCIFNVGRWSPALRVEDATTGSGRSELKVTALQDIHRLDLLGQPGMDRAHFEVDGKTTIPQSGPSWPERYTFTLVTPIRQGRVFRVVCDAGNGDNVQLLPNPALFEACRFSAARAYERDFRNGGDPPETYRNVVRPAAGVISACQPFSLTLGQPEESDGMLFSRAARRMLGRCIERRSDVARMVLGHFPSINQATCTPGDWEEAGASGWKRHFKGQVLRIVCSQSDAITVANLKASVERFVRRHVTANSPILVDIEPMGIV
jgi:hypothetical protein